MNQSDKNMGGAREPGVVSTSEQERLRKITEAIRLGNYNEAYNNEVQEVLKNNKRQGTSIPSNQFTQQKEDTLPEEFDRYNKVFRYSSPNFSNMYRNGLGEFQTNPGNSQDENSLTRLLKRNRRNTPTSLPALQPQEEPSDVNPNSPNNPNSQENSIPWKEKGLKKKDKKEEERKIASGSISTDLKRTTKVKLAIFCSIFGTIMITFIAIISMIADTKSASIIMGEMVSEDKSLIKDIIDEMGDDVGHGSQDVGLGNNTLYEYQERFKVLGNVFSSEHKCIGEECLTRAEYRYYLKLADIALRYKNKYGVTLDWVLLSATASYNDVTDEEIMALHANDYNESLVENYAILLDLDWDYDYKNIPGYQYLSPDDYRYDLQILAKNMVKKTTTQTCIRSRGTAVDIVATQTDIDLEDSYFEVGGQRRLVCPTGTTYDRSSTYELDKNKYDEFLLEYLEHKFYLPSDEPPGSTNSNGNVNVGYTEGNSLSSTMVNLAISQKGISGRPNIFTRWLGPINGYPSNGYAYPWCATFVSWVVANTNYNGKNLNSIINYRSASAVAWARHFRDASNLQFKYSKHYGGNYTPKQGDLIFFTWKNTGFNKESLYGIDHVAIVSKVEGNSIYTIEGNINNSSVKGGNVAERKYDTSAYQIDGYGVWY